jgi:hypothetical protein
VSRQPTSRTNFCGAEKLPLSPRCCDIAPQIFGRSAFWGVGLSIRNSREPLLFIKTLNNRLTGFAGRDFAVNIKVAIAHDCYSLLMLRGNAQVPGTVAHGLH